MLAVLILSFFIIPQFESIYASFDSELPAATQILLNIIDNLPVILTFGTIGFTALYWVFRTISFDGLKLKIPLLGKILQQYYHVQYLNILSILLTNSHDVVASLDFLAENSGNVALRNRINIASKNIAEGKKISDALEEQNIFPYAILKLIEVGETSGKMAEVLTKARGYYSQLFDDKITRFLSLLEPVVILLMGGIVGGIIITLYLPIFGFVNVVR